MKTLYICVGVLVLAGAAFYGGAYGAASGLPLPYLPHPAASTPNNTIEGEVASLDTKQGLVGVTDKNGNSYVLAIDTNTRILHTPVQTSVQELRVGTKVVVGASSDGLARLIQIQATAPDTDTR